jgi:hypothetical protein
VKPAIVHQPDLFAVEDDEYRVVPIDVAEAKPFILEIHYAKRMPPISHCFGLQRNGHLLGIVTYGKPASRTLCDGVCGPEWSTNVIELNRLCLLDNQPNDASRLVGASLKLLPRPSVVVSYADTGHDHIGIIYQATNFLYTGHTVPRDDWFLEGEENSHIRRLAHMADETSIGGMAGLHAMYGDRLKRRPRSIKHRYVTFVGSRRERRSMRMALRYEIQPYPKKTEGQ